MARIVTLEQSKRFQMGKGDSRYLVSPEIGAQQITLNYSIFQPGHEFPQHFHDISADIFIVLEGGVSVRQGDNYIPITAGDLAYIPPGEVHGTVNQTKRQAILISFQSPPDAVMYRGERDPAVTGTVPKPPPNHVSTVQIRQLTSGKHNVIPDADSWNPTSPLMDAKEMQLAYYQLKPVGKLSISASAYTETVWFVWDGEIMLNAGGDDLCLSKHTGAFVPPGEDQFVTNRGNELAHLIRCQTVAQ